jgi:hypothetical protein
MHTAPSICRYLRVNQVSSVPAPTSQPAPNHRVNVCTVVRAAESAGKGTFAGAVGGVPPSQGGACQGDNRSQAGAQGSRVSTVLEVINHRAPVPFARTGRGLTACQPDIPAASLPPSSLRIVRDEVINQSLRPFLRPAPSRMFVVSSNYSIFERASRARRCQKKTSRAQST